MITTLSTKGQVVLPLAARMRLGLTPGTRFTCTIREGEIILKPEINRPKKARIVKSKVTGLPVIVPSPGTPPLTAEAVQYALSDFP